MLASTAGGAGMKNSVNTLMGAEEQIYHSTLKEMRENQIDHFKDMDQRGCLNKFEKNLLR